MTDLKNVVRQLQNQRDDTQQQVHQLDQAISALEGFGGRNGFRSARGGSRNMSASARQRIAAAQRVRWAKWHKQHGAVQRTDSKAPAKRTVSAAARRRMAAAQRRRWAKRKKAA